MSNQFDLNKFNSFLNSAKKAIECGPECQRNKEKEKLKQQYINAQTNLDLAEPQYQEAKKNYYTYVSGVSGYNEMVESELTQEAQTYINNFKQSYTEEINKIKLQINAYDGILVNYRNIVDLYNTYKAENAKLLADVKDKSNDVITNERKTYYQDQAIGDLNVYYYYFLWSIYIVVLIIYWAVRLMNYHSNYSLLTVGLLFIFFVALPFISTWVLGKTIQLIYWLFGLLPKNVYK